MVESKNFVFSLLLTVKMAGSIKLFQFLQKCYQTIGIHPSQRNHKPLLINCTKWIFVICQTQLLFSTVAFFVFEAESMFEYGFGFFALIAIINGIVIYLILIWQSENIVEFIENCEDFIVESKCGTFPCFNFQLKSFENYDVFF